MAPKALDRIRSVWAFLALALLVPGIASAETCEPEQAAVALALEALPQSSSSPLSEPHLCCGLRSASIAAAHGLRAGLAAPIAAVDDRVRAEIPVATRACAPFFLEHRWTRYCARSARLLR